jgi:hypothetical protein
MKDQSFKDHLKKIRKRATERDNELT